MALILLGRGTSNDACNASINTLKEGLKDLKRSDAVDALEKCYKYTQNRPATAAAVPGDDTYLYIHPGNELAGILQGPDKPAEAAFERAKKEPSIVIIDTLANIDVDAIEEIVTEHRARVHDATHSITIQSTRRPRDNLTPATRRAIEVLTGTAEHADALLAGVEWQGGRPPLGCTSKAGRLAPDDNYDDVCRTLQKVRAGTRTKTEAANRLGCARKTIDNALNRPDLYRLD